MKANFSFFQSFCVSWMIFTSNLPELFESQIYLSEFHVWLKFICIYFFFDSKFEFKSQDTKVWFVVYFNEIKSTILLLTYFITKCYIINFFCNNIFSVKKSSQSYRYYFIFFNLLILFQFRILDTFH